MLRKSFRCVRRRAALLVRRSWRSPSIYVQKALSWRRLNITIVDLDAQDALGPEKKRAPAPAGALHAFAAVAAFVWHGLGTRLVLVSSPCMMRRTVAY